MGIKNNLGSHPKMSFNISIKSLSLLTLYMLVGCASVGIPERAKEEYLDDVVNYDPCESTYLLVDSYPDEAEPLILEAVEKLKKEKPENADGYMAGLLHGMCSTPKFDLNKPSFQRIMLLFCTYSSFRVRYQAFYEIRVTTPPEVAITFLKPLTKHCNLDIRREAEETLKSMQSKTKRN